MTRARQELISLLDTPWYHLVNHCVRRAFLDRTDHVEAGLGVCYGYCLLCGDE